MGNCAETCRQRQSGEIWKEPEEFQLQEIRNSKAANRSGGGVGKIDGGGGGGGGRVRVKIVLTREELELLLIQLGGDSSSRKGGPKSNLEQVLGEIERGRRRNSSVSEAVDVVGSWKPSLDSIMEVPEVNEMERSR
ncbi:uncharacterized protein LOC115740835 [Rhodamnia argentea]|uniref:Uncharacterized protein LOC115740835 n=1 Tax=Rhodamnia argentea TaxID=178133 RepID=A0A8B8P6B3_9MYRT|nr:uncharacterized protein LOC115740835 [Rhodamnia argentea]